MKKSLKKFALISMSTMALASVAPVLGIYGQESSEETTVEEMSEAALEETSVEGEEEASALQTALEDAIVAYQETHPESAITKISIKPLEEGLAGESEELLGEAEEEVSAVEGEISEALSEETTVAEGEVSEAETSAEESSEADGMAEEDKAYEIAIEGVDGTVKYNSSTGQEIEGEAEESSEGEASESSEAMDASAEETVEAPAEGESSEPIEGEVAEETSVEGEAVEAMPIDTEALLPLDEITKVAEETAGFGEAFEYELSVNVDKHESAIWTVKVAENPDAPEEGKQGEVIIDAITGEVIETSGDIEATESGAASEQSASEDQAAEGESAEETKAEGESSEEAPATDASSVEETTAQ